MLSGFDGSARVFRARSVRYPLGDSAEADFHHRQSGWAESMASQLLSPATHPEMLVRIGRYEVERLIGSGGMGVVFKAIDTELNRHVAIKLLAPFLAGNGAARQRFSREAKAAAAVVHEHVVPIYKVESNGDSPFLVMPYVAGESLQARPDREGPLELCEILRIGMQISEGLDAAHLQGLIHRDIKPSNILLEQGVERSLITDFGLARTTDDASLTNTGHYAGTPQYMSPEQARGDAIDFRSDLFSLGSVIYTMCAGRPPFRAET
ncbi:MAG: serine/threonine protein kinase, partial [Pirellulaceae bacterium]|nr:serine/threonine protein kinase [Pirellulaceae bacterium]